MSPSTSSVPGPIAVKQQPAWRLLDAVVKFLIRRRIVLSAIVFAVLVGRNVIVGFKPHDLANIRDPYGVAGGLLVIVGLALRSWAAGILHKDRELTTTGPYCVIRNPLYVGSFLMMFGFCAILADPKNLLFILGPVLLLYVVKVRQEERQLAKKFPEKWLTYFHQTPRFIPRFARVDTKADWRAAQWMRSREYRALGATIIGLAAIKMWQTYL